jgi:hypothetical protein
VTTNPEFMDEVHKLLARYYQLTFRIMANELNVNKESVRSTLTTELGKRKIVQSLWHTLSVMRKN